MRLSVGGASRVRRHLPDSHPYVTAGPSRKLKTYVYKKVEIRALIPVVSPNEREGGREERRAVKTCKLKNLHSCLVLTSPDTAACEAVALSWPAHNTWPAPPVIGRATATPETTHLDMSVRGLTGPNGPSPAKILPRSYPPPQDLVDGGAFLQCTLRHHLGPHFLHVQHEGVQGFLYVDLFLFLRFLLRVWLFPAEDKRAGRWARRRPAFAETPPAAGLRLLTSCWGSWCHCGWIPAWRWAWRWLGVGYPWCANCGEGAPCVGGT